MLILCIAQGYEIIAGSMNGQVTSFHPRELFWTLDIGRESKTTATLGMVNLEAKGEGDDSTSNTSSI